MTSRNSTKNLLPSKFDHAWEGFFSLKVVTNALFGVKTVLAFMYVAVKVEFQATRCQGVGGQGVGEGDGCKNNNKNSLSSSVNNVSAL